MQKTKRILAANNGSDDPSLLASTFQFVAPVVGPFTKDAFIAAFTGFKLEEARPLSTHSLCSITLRSFVPVDASRRVRERRFHA